MNKDVAAIKNPDDLAAFIVKLRNDLKESSNEWENPTLDRYLEALSACVKDRPAWFMNRDGETPLEPTWKLIGQMLLTAKIYE